MCPSCCGGSLPGLHSHAYAAGGLSCCHHGAILLDADQPVDPRTDSLVFKFRFYYQPYTPAGPVESTPHPAASVTALAPSAPSHLLLHRLWLQTEAYAAEYDVVPCAAGTPTADCVHTIRARLKVRDLLVQCGPWDPDCHLTGRGVQIIYANGHCHAPSCLSQELYNADTGELLCRQQPVYGQGLAPLFDEPGYAAIPPCLFGSEAGLQAPITLTWDTNLLAVKQNNNTYGHYGEMAYWQVRWSLLHAVSVSHLAVSLPSPRAQH